MSWRRLFPGWPGGGANVADLSHFRHVGTVPFDSFYFAGGLASAVSNNAPGINNIRAVPYIESRGGRIDQLGFRVTTGGGAGSVTRAGIYRATSDTNIYPGALVVDGGEFDTTGAAAAKLATVDAQLLPRTLYWFVVLCGVASPTLNALALTSGLHMLTIGISSDLAASLAPVLAASLTYGPLPATLPAGALPSGALAPVIAVRYSA